MIWRIPTILPITTSGASDDDAADDAADDADAESETVAATTQTGRKRHRTLSNNATSDAMQIASPVEGEDSSDRDDNLHGSDSSSSDKLASEGSSGSSSVNLNMAPLPPHVVIAIGPTSPVDTGIHAIRKVDAPVSDLTVSELSVGSWLYEFASNNAGDELIRRLKRPEFNPRGENEER